MTRPRPPSDLAPKFLLRLPEGLRERIGDSAKSNGRSMNAELVARLLASYGEDGDTLALADMPTRPDPGAPGVREILVEQTGLLREIVDALKARA